MEASPAPALVVTETEVLLQVLIVVLDAPALMGSADQLVERRALGQRRQAILGRLFLARGPLDEQPLLGPQPRLAGVAPRVAHPSRGEAAAECGVGAFAPADGLIRLGGQGLRQRLDALGLASWRAPGHHGRTAPAGVG